MALEFLSPVSPSIVNLAQSLSQQAIGASVQFDVEIESLPYNTAKGVALVGVRQNEDEDFLYPTDAVRKSFYRLYKGNWSVTIYDLGDIIEGAAPSDTDFLVTKVVELLAKKQITVILLGSSKELTYPAYRAFDNLDQMVNLVSIDSRLGFGDANGNISTQSYIHKVIMDKPNNLFNFSNIGYQTYLNTQEEIDLIDKLYFDAVRLGNVINDMSSVEPLVRVADIVSLDVTSVQASFLGPYAHHNPNGFNAREVCAVSRYVGMGDRLSVFGVYEFDDHLRSVALVSQILWYFVEGYCLRVCESEVVENKGFKKFNVLVEDQDLCFFKSEKTEKWWVELSFIDLFDNKTKTKTLLPCTYNDYVAATQQQYPDRWWRAYRRVLG